MAVLRNTSPGAIRPEDLTSSWAMIAAIVFFGVATFTLQSMRIRDIGGIRSAWCLPGSRS
jgi:hypothetical protein